MKEVDQIMGMADRYALTYSLVREDSRTDPVARKALRDAIEQALSARVLSDNGKAVHSRLIQAAHELVAAKDVPAKWGCVGPDAEDIAWSKFHELVDYVCVLIDSPPCLPAAPQPPAQEVRVPNIPGLEADPSAFVRWASKAGYDMTSHPMHFLFLNEKTAAARAGWKAACDFYAAPQPPAQREWVGLTDEEMADALPDGFQLLGEPGNFSGITLTRLQLRAFANNYVAKLREKNTGGAV